MSQNSHPIGNSSLIATVNSRLVLQAVRALQPTYRAEVARHTSLKPATVTGIVNDLIDNKLLCETAEYGETTPRGGRPPQLLNVNAGARSILAVDLEPDVIRVALTDLLGEVLAFDEMPVDRFSEPQVVCDSICDLCQEMLSSTRHSELLGAGLSLPGIIDRENGVLVSSTNMPKWHDVPIRDTLARRLNTTVRVGRSVHLALLHEKWRRPLQGDWTTMLFSLRTGIGLSLMTRGEIYLGALGFDGEIGHTVVDVGGRPCECGNRGCLEAYVSASAVCGRAKDMMQNGRCRALHEMIDDGRQLRPEMIYRMAKTGDADCAEIVRDVGHYIGIAASNMINVFAPQEVIICGSIDTADDLILGVLKEQVERSTLPKARESLVIRLAHAKEKAPLLGAAVLVAQELFDLPSLKASTIG